MTPEEHARMARELYEQLSRTEHTVNRERFESIVADHIRRALIATAQRIPIIAERKPTENVNVD